ncbi:bifunctional DNA-formamidopyrimidine glycosylase/DNA-(apurinic or apyrimidinic site) lyase [Candidatus Bandiella numerosa]|uniref:bifunctional DNA-formamidopyrimidine glycosylase/DNA-(apurinic or apyrimidinic site) lyase n=1 Tax=Candidatus Bandiella numerosa TaxID=2570586 RepID=UPI00249F87C1|nr:bifunctional DNA-formamidopyrimidine glycosylase/DNA-(apurinic or apyrimidinic site) lyase [Candidatus Bandiella numerosa]WHA04856.1 bifunctional DNA-formamidopyrimidine glycosylase/DNA-(apurinic or apyrimidinic site) lyase [Candidatus Bandiella numerosa]
MPELPEVETVVCGLKKILPGKKIIKILRSHHNLRIPYPKNFSEELTGANILEVTRLAKYIIIHTDLQKSIIIHLGMSGRLLLQNITNLSPQKHDHVIFHLSDNKSLIYNDPRRFGLVTMIKTTDIEKYNLFKNLGIDPLSDQFNTQYLKAKIHNKNTLLKDFLMNSRNVVGIGNIYANEILYSAKLYPLKPVKTLTLKEIELIVICTKKILNDAINAGGSSLKDYIAPDGVLGNFQNSFKVYNKENQKCFYCNELIVKNYYHQRATYFCQNCQRN